MLDPKLLFVLPASGGGGGANSVVQESIGLADFGVPVSIAIPSGHRDKFVHGYPELAQTGVSIASYADADALSALAAAAHIVCATTNGSVRHVAEALEKLDPATRPRTAYYVQDYEPLFYQPGSPEWDEARASYTRLPGCTLFAKTRWLCNIVQDNHGVRVNQVEPSLDQRIYYPDLSRSSVRISVLAMLRPQTPRRAPLRTLRLMEALAARYGQRIDLQVFGSSDTTLADMGIPLSPLIRNHGSLRRIEVPALMRQCDLFLDLSDYQAFGRTGLEAMASACVPLVPTLGGSAEYAVDRVNCYAVDTRSDALILEAIEDFVGLSPTQRNNMKLSALRRSARYTVAGAALSELALFDSMTR